MKKAIFTIVLLFLIGCDKAPDQKTQHQEENMTISVPTTVEIFATNVSDPTAAFDEMATYDLDDIVLYDLGETYPSTYIKTSEVTILDYQWTDIVKVGDVVRWYVDDTLAIVNTEIGVFQNRGITDTYIAPSLAELLTQQSYTVGNFKFQGVWKGTYPATYYVVRIRDLSDTIIDEAPLYYLNEDGTKLVPPYPDGSILNNEAMIYDNNVIYFTTSRGINPTTDYQFTPFVDGTTTLGFLGFSEYQPNMALLPFDDRNATTATVPGVTMTYTVKGITNKFDTVALGRIKADSIDIIFKDPLGVQVGTTISKILDTSRDPDGNLADWYTTDISYSSAVMEPDSTVEITVTGEAGEIELGSIILGQSVDAGFTKLNLQNSYIDYSVVEENQFGAIDYVERGKVAIYNGSCAMFVDDYDRIDRLMTSIGAQLIILNGSDKKNATPDGQSVFASTQKIGRLFNFKQMTKLDGKRLAQMADYTFTLKATI